MGRPWRRKAGGTALLLPCTTALLLQQSVGTAQILMIVFLPSLTPLVE